LPALEWLLVRSVAMPLQQPDWRDWLQQHVAQVGDSGTAGTGPMTDTAGRAGLAGPAGIVTTALAARQSRAVDATRHYWLATPVHWTAGLDTVRLHPQGLLLLQAHEVALLIDDFERVFVGSGWALHATGGRELLLAGPAHPDCEADDPALWCGLSPKAGMVRGADAKPLRQLGAEMEMWLHDHAVNRARANAGAPIISALWLWGAGPASECAPRPEAGLLLANDLYARSLWQLLRAPAAALPPAWLSGSGDATCMVVLPWSGVHPAAVAQGLEERWLAPIMADWRGGRITELTLIAGNTRYRLPRAARWNFWRRARPWWETLLA
jgi:hypothetical protein